MRSSTIVGAGQAGLHLGIGLLAHGYDVTVFANHTPEQVRDGRVMSSQCMFGAALDHERSLGLDAWADRCPPAEGIAFAIPGGQGGPPLVFHSRTHHVAKNPPDPGEGNPS